MTSDNFGTTFAVLFVVFGLIYVGLLGLMVWAGWRIVSRAGYPGWYVFGQFVPILNIVLFFLFAFQEWPVQRELAWLRAQVYGPTGRPGGYPPRAMGGGYGLPPAGGYPGAPSWVAPGGPGAPGGPPAARPDDGPR